MSEASKAAQKNYPHTLPAPPAAFFAQPFHHGSDLRPPACEPSVRTQPPTVLFIERRAITEIPQSVVKVTGRAEFQAWSLHSTQYQRLHLAVSDEICSSNKLTAVNRSRRFDGAIREKGHLLSEDEGEMTP